MSYKNGFNEPNIEGGKVKIIKFTNGNKAKENLIAYEKKQELKANKKNKAKRNRKVKKRVRLSSSKSFYKSEQWYQLRYQVLRKYEAKCMCCGRSSKEHGIVIHVDHIKPRSKYPSLALSFDNMQLLCAACNYGKSNIDNTDWRPLSSHDIHLIKETAKFKE